MKRVLSFIFQGGSAEMYNGMNKGVECNYGYVNKKIMEKNNVGFIDVGEIVPQEAMDKIDNLEKNKDKIKPMNKDDLLNKLEEKK
jgi:hypothetical protein